MSTPLTFTRRLESDGCESIFVESFPERIETTLQIAAVAHDPCARLMIHCTNGEAEYRLVDWDEDRELATLERIHVYAFTPAPDGTFGPLPDADWHVPPELLEARG